MYLDCRVKYQSMSVNVLFNFIDKLIISTVLIYQCPKFFDSVQVLCRSQYNLNIRYYLVTVFAIGQYFKGKPIKIVNAYRMKSTSSGFCVLQKERWLRLVDQAPPSRLIRPRKNHPID